MARRKKPPEHVNHERWLVSYADFITLLFAFFTTLYAISTVDAQKMGKMVMSMRASFESSIFPGGADRLVASPGSTEGIVAGGESLRDASLPRQPAGREAAQSLKSKLGVSDSLSSLKRKIESLIGLSVLGTKVQTRMDGRGLVISLGEGGFFDSGSDQLKSEGRALLDSIAAGLVLAPHHIRVEGHTDDVPIRNSRFASNWELSTARATAIVAHLISKFGFAADRMSAAGYAEFRPVATNDTAEGRARNRRVDIIVLNPQYVQLEP